MEYYWTKEWTIRNGVISDGWKGEKDDGELVNFCELCMSLLLWQINVREAIVQLRNLFRSPVLLVMSVLTSSILHCVVSLQRLRIRKPMSTASIFCNFDNIKVCPSSSTTAHELVIHLLTQTKVHTTLLKRETVGHTIEPYNQLIRTLIRHRQIFSSVIQSRHMYLLNQHHPLPQTDSCLQHASNLNSPMSLYPITLRAEKLTFVG
ncbi:hypothetical protein BKA66DRAFT_139050 [Pyrenochaeta sp. MPI-SDFR-AT-0127]|nr:hypothetical protein BKA66DRAFT_139050 [Pyrenochaeta sp. MPI-SDFR-AT-0127]